MHKKTVFLLLPLLSFASLNTCKEPEPTEERTFEEMYQDELVQEEVRTGKRCRICKVTLKGIQTHSGFRTCINCYDNLQTKKHDGNTL